MARTNLSKITQDRLSNIQPWPSLRRSITNQLSYTDSAQRVCYHRPVKRPSLLQVSYTSLLSGRASDLLNVARTSLISFSVKAYTPDLRIL